MRFGRVILSNSSIVSDTVIAMPVWRRIIVGHSVIAHVIVLRVLWLTPSNDIPNGWGNMLPGLVFVMITNIIHCWELETARADEPREWEKITMPITYTIILYYTGITMQLAWVQTRMGRFGGYWLWVWEGSGMPGGICCRSLGCIHSEVEFAVMLEFHLTWYYKCDGFPSTISTTRTVSVWVLTEYYLEGGLCRATISVVVVLGFL